MRLSVTAVRPVRWREGVVVCNFMGDDGVIGVVLQLDPEHARAAARSLLLMAEEADREDCVAAAAPNPKVGPA